MCDRSIHHMDKSKCTTGDNHNLNLPLMQLLYQLQSPVDFACFTDIVINYYTFFLHCPHHNFF